MVPDVADEGGALAFAFQFEEHMAGRMAGRAVDLDEIIEPVGPAAHQIGLAVFKDRHHAFAEGAELGRAFLRIGVDFREIIDVGLGKYVARIGKCRHPFAVLLPRVPADMIVMQMRAHDDVDFFRLGAGGGQPLQIRLVQHAPRTGGRA